MIGKVIAIDEQGSVWVAGQFSSGAPNYEDAFLAQFSVDSELMQAVTWGITDNDYVNSLAFGAQGSVWVAGGYGYSNTGLLAQFSPTGNLTKAIHIGFR